MPLLLDKSDIAKKISKLTSLAELETLRVQYLGKKGTLTSEMKSLSSLSIEERNGFLIALAIILSLTNLLFKNIN